MIYATHAMMRPKLTTRVVRARCVGDIYAQAPLPVSLGLPVSISLVLAHQTSHLCRGFIGEPGAHANCSANSCELDSGPRTRYSSRGLSIQQAADTVLGQTVRVAHDRHQTVLPTTARAPHLYSKQR